MHGEGERERRGEEGGAGRKGGERDIGEGERHELPLTSSQLPHHLP